MRTSYFRIGALFQHEVIRVAFIEVAFVANGILVTGMLAGVVHRPIGVVVSARAAHEHASDMNAFKNSKHR